MIGWLVCFIGRKKELDYNKAKGQFDDFRNYRRHTPGPVFRKAIATAPAWTILRMNFYAEALVQQAEAALNQDVLTGLGENRMAFVARGDVAAAAAGILTGDVERLGGRPPKPLRDV